MGSFKAWPYQIPISKWLLVFITLTKFPFPLNKPALHLIELSKKSANVIHQITLSMIILGDKIIRLITLSMIVLCDNIFRLITLSMILISHNIIHLITLSMIVLSDNIFHLIILSMIILSKNIIHLITSSVIELSDNIFHLLSKIFKTFCWSYGFGMRLSAVFGISI